MKTPLETKFRKIRSLFPVTEKKRGIVYLNSASTGPLCLPVKKALFDYYEMTQYLEKSAIDHIAFASLDNIRRLGAALIGARQDELGFGFNTTYGLNIAAFGLPLRKGDEVLLSDIEFPANVYPWLALQERGIKVKFVKSSGLFFDVDILRKSISRRSKVLSLSYVQFFNGYKNDLFEIGKLCREHGLYFVVDGIQGCGVEPLNVHEANIDIFSTGAQKWLLSPLGTGIFYIRKDLQNKLHTPLASWLSVDWKLNFTDLFHYDLPYFDAARRFEMGTYPYAHVFALEKSLELIFSLGVKNIQSHNHDLIDKLIHFLDSDRRFRIKSSLEDRHRSSILAFTCDEARLLHKDIVRNKIIASFREGSIRVSTHLFNNHDDIRRLTSVLRR